MIARLVPENKGVIIRRGLTSSEMTVLYRQITVWTRNTEIVDGEVVISHSRAWISPHIITATITKGEIVIELSLCPFTTGLLPWLDETLRVLRQNRASNEATLVAWRKPPYEKPDTRQPHILLPAFPPKPA
jgi:hypothetical protein